MVIGRRGGEQLGDGRVVRVRHAKIALKDPGDPLDVLRHQRLIETELLADGLDLARRGGRAGDLTRSVTRDQVNEHEDDDGDDE